MKYKIIADSGSTKTDWVVYLDGVLVKRIATQGINPFMLPYEDIVRILRNELIPYLNAKTFVSIEFYGAGCRGEKTKVVADALREVLDAQQVVVESDMLGAVRSVCGNAEEGIVCILGTGSNSCLYDGQNIVQNVSPLGFILGDEGSGAVLGKRLLGDILKKQMPDAICRDFSDEYGLTVDDIIQKVYREKFPNRFLASFAPFINKYKSEVAVQTLLQDEFVRFFVRNVGNYHRSDLPVHFIGSIAYYFHDELRIAARKCGYTIGKIKKSPLDEAIF